MAEMYAAGSGKKDSSTTFIWTGTKGLPTIGRYTIVIDYLVSGSPQYYKATNVQLTNGAGSVAWSSFSQFN